MLKTLLYPFLTLAIVLLPSCSSGNNSLNETSESVFYPYDFYEEIVKNSSDCNLNYLTPDYEPPKWSSKRTSEADKFSWVEYSSFSDYYEFRLEDNSYKAYDLEDVTSTQKCIEFLTVQISDLNSFEETDANSLQVLYQDLLENRQSYLDQAKLMASTEINKTNRAKYLDFEGAKRTLDESLVVTFFEVRKLIDYSWFNSVKVFIERCPDAFSILGRDTQVDGSILLTNTSDSSKTVDIKVRYQDNEDIFVGYDLVYETVPSNSKLRTRISGGGASGPITGGAIFPARCTLDLS